MKIKILNTIKYVIPLQTYSWAGYELCGRRCPSHVQWPGFDPSLQPKKKGENSHLRSFDSQHKKGKKRILSKGFLLSIMSPTRYLMT